MSAPDPREEGNHETCEQSETRPDLGGGAAETAHRTAPRGARLLSVGRRRVHSGSRADERQAEVGALYTIIDELRQKYPSPAAIKALDMVVRELGHTQDNLNEASRDSRAGRFRPSASGC